MKNFYLLIVLLITFCFLSGVMSQELTNYVIDPGFEEGTAFTELNQPGWNHIFDDSFLDEYFPRSGFYAGGLYEIEVGGAYNDAQYHQRVRGLVPGESYIVTCFGRLDYYTADPGEWGLYLGVQYFDYEQDLANKIGVNILSADYVPVVAKFVMGDTNTQADIWTWKANGSEAQTDDWGVWDYHNFLQNADFEDGALDNGWSFYKQNADVDSMQANDGTWCGVINQGSGGMFQLLSGLKPNTTYGLTAFAKVTNDGDMAWIGVKNHGNDEVTIEVTSTVYTQGTLSFTMGAESTTAEVYFWKNAGGPAYVDDYLACLMVPAEEGNSVNSAVTPELPESYSLEQNYPNPFNPNTTIEFALPISEMVKITIYDMTGAEVKTLTNRSFSQGYHRVVWDGRDRQDQVVAAGIYFCKLQAGTYSQVRKLTFIK